MDLPLVVKVISLVLQGKLNSSQTAAEMQAILEPELIGINRSWNAITGQME